MGACYSRSGQDIDRPSKHQPYHSPTSGSGLRGGYSPLWRSDVRAKKEKPATCTDCMWIAEAPVSDSNPTAADKGVSASDSGIESIGPSQESTPQSNPDASKSRTCNHTQKARLATSGSVGSQLDKNRSSLSSLPFKSAKMVAAQDSCPNCSSKNGSPKTLRVDSGKGLRKRRSGNRLSRFSWKSADSIEWMTNWVTSIDRSRSETSDLFSDDISLHAPLADFDSIDLPFEDSFLLRNGHRCCSADVAGLSDVQELAECSNTDKGQSQSEFIEAAHSQSEPKGVTDHSQSEIRAITDHSQSEVRGVSDHSQFKIRSFGSNRSLRRSRDKGLQKASAKSKDYVRKSQELSNATPIVKSLSKTATPIIRSLSKSEDGLLADQSVQTVDESFARHNEQTFESIPLLAFKECSRDPKRRSASVSSDGRTLSPQNSLLDEELSIFPTDTSYCKTKDVSSPGDRLSQYSR